MCEVLLHCYLNMNDIQNQEYTGVNNMLVEWRESHLFTKKMFIGIIHSLPCPLVLTCHYIRRGYSCQLICFICEYHNQFGCMFKQTK